MPAEIASLPVGSLAPKQLDGLLAFVAGRAFPGVERVEPHCYARAFRIGKTPGAVVVHIDRSSGALSATPYATHLDDHEGVVTKIRRVFDLDAPLPAIRAHLRRDPALALALKRVPAPRIPRAWEPFELAVRAILGQQISVKAASTLAARMVTLHGASLSTKLAQQSGLQRLFPTTESLASAELTPLGIVRARAHAIRTLAATAQHQPELFDGTRGLDHFVTEFIRLPGIGRWTAQYVALRALGHPDAFPEGDLGLVRAYASLAGRDITLRELTQIAEHWRPWRGYAAMLLWMSEAAVAGKQSGG